MKNDIRLNLINVISLAIGMAATIVIISYIYHEFNYDAQFMNTDRIYRVITHNKEIGTTAEVNYAALAKSLLKEYPEIENAVRISFYYGYLALSANNNMHNEHEAIFADPSFFKFFSFPLIKGNPENCLESPNSVVISLSNAKKYFGDTDPLNKQIKLGNNKLLTVKGVFEDFPSNSNFKGGFVFPLQIISKVTQVWIEPSWKYQSDIHTFVLLKPNVNYQQLSNKISGFISGYVKEYTGILDLQPLKNIHTNNQIAWESRPTANKYYLYLLMAVVFVILISTGMNFFFLYTGISAKRSVFTEVKKVCGASKSIIFQDHINETIIYIFISTIISSIIIYFYYNISASSFLPVTKYWNSRIALLISVIILAFLFITSFLPAWVVSNYKNKYIFKSDNSNSEQFRNRNLIIIGQFTITIVLLALSSLLFKQLKFIQKHDPGYAKDELITIPLNMHLGDGIYNENIDAFSEELKKQAGVKNVTLAFSSPASISTSSENFDWEGRSENKQVSMQWNTVFFDYFETLDLKIIKGRSFNRNFPGDMFDYEKQTCAYILNQKAVKEMGLENPIGKIFKGYGEGPIVGIVEDFNFKSVHNEITPMCFAMNVFYYNEIIVRINPDVTNVLDNIKSVWTKFVPDYPVEFNYVTDQLNKLYSPERKLTNIINIFSLVAIFIACMGLLAHTILTLQNKIKEIGIRKVNGAKNRELLAMLNKNVLKWIIISLILAIPVSYFIMNKWLENFAYKTNISWWIFALSGTLALLIALLTVSWQTWQAARRNPVEALRYE